MLNEKKYSGMVLREIRKRRNLSAEQIAEKTGISVQSVYGYERGEYLPKAENEMKLFSQLGIDRSIFHGCILSSIVTRTVNSGGFSTEPTVTMTDRIPIEEIATRIIGESSWKAQGITVGILKPSDFVGVPLLTVAQAATMQPKSIAGDNAPDTGEVCFFDRAKEGDFAVQVSGSSMLPWYPEGTKILIGRGERPRDGDRVVAMLDGRIEPIFKVYVDLADRFALLSINKDVGNGPMVFDKMDRESVFWVWPIKASIRDERALDVAMKRAGVRHFWETVKEELKQAAAK